MRHGSRWEVPPTTPAPGVVVGPPTGGLCVSRGGGGCSLLRQFIIVGEGTAVRRIGERTEWNAEPARQRQPLQGCNNKCVLYCTYRMVVVVVFFFEGSNCLSLILFEVESMRTVKS